MDAMLRASDTLREALDKIEPEFADLNAGTDSRALDEHRAFYCRVLLVRFIALHLSSSLTSDQMMWWTR